MLSNTLTVAFRADASIQMGTGHIMRCLTLAEALRDQGHQCQFICRDHEGHLGELIRRKGFALHLLPRAEPAELGDETEYGLAHAQWLGSTWQIDAEQTLHVISGCDPDWMVVDHYALDVRWERKVACAVGHVMVLDDLADRVHECTLLLDQNLGTLADDYRRLIPADCALLLGPKYALLRGEFAQWRTESLQKRSAQHVCEHLLINFGGTDPDNLTDYVLTAIEEHMPDDLNITVVLGNNAPWIENVKKHVAALGPKFNVKVGAESMAWEMYKADVAIGAAGSTSWERCTLGLPAIVLSQADNQNKILNALQIAGAIEKITFEDIESHLSGLLMQLAKNVSKRKYMSDCAAGVCDGLGVERVISVMTSRGVI